ncbi:hypothetical protein EVAR_45736_1 [Eumeta japonica]|uniref:Uncharacterized protein n=1 Tax=Eumeta variegata TaxID=151549 RepID=A0A4C1WWY5_EUMVA|nr:hypothetical protein EVAR_45736_1 [Eumeta japonica]
MSEIGIKSRMESRIENGARISIESETDTETKNGLGFKTSLGSSVSRIRIENDTGIENDINRYKRKKNYVHAGAAAGINYMSKSPTRKYRTTSAGQLVFYKNKVSKIDVMVLNETKT